MTKGLHSERDRILDVVKTLAGELNPGRDFEQLGQSAHLEYDLGIGSLERHELTLRLEEALGGRLSSQVILQARQCGDLFALSPADPAKSSAPQLLSSGQAIPPPPLTAVSLIEALAYQARLQPEREALVWLKEGHPWATQTYSGLQQEAAVVAAGLAERGIQPGDRVALMLPSCPEFATCLFAILMLGAIPVPLYPPFRADQIEEHVRRQGAIIQSAGIRLMIAFPEMSAVARLLRLNLPGLNQIVTVANLLGQTPLRPRLAATTDLALIQYTSGSTGNPKGVMLSHENILANIRAHMGAVEANAADVVVTWLPLYHDMGLIGTLLGPIHCGCPAVLMGPQDFLGRPSRWLRAISDYRGSLSPAPNFAYDLCARKIPDSELAGLDLSSWRVALNGAEAVRPDTLDRFARRFAPYGMRPSSLMPVYGLAEATLAVTFPPLARPPIVDCVDRDRLEREGCAWPTSAGEAQFASCGRPLEKMEVRIVDKKGQLVDDRWVGHLQFRGPSALQGYFDNPEETARVMVGDGWVDTGDKAYLADGELYIVGRHKDVILKAGRNLHAQDVEESVADLPGVRRGCVAAFALPDPESATEQLVVVLETRLPPQDHPELEVAIKRRIAETVGLVPDQVVLVAPQSVPKTPSGKIRRSECRRRLLAGTLGQQRGLIAQAFALVRTGLAGWMRQLLALPGQGLRVAWWKVCMVTAGVMLLAIARLSPAAGRRLARRLSQLLLRLMGVQLEVKGTASTDEACVVVANHTSKFDAIVLLAAWPGPLHFLVAQGVAKGMLEPLVRPLGYVTIARGKSDQTLQEMTDMEGLLKKGASLAAFPEGGLEHWPGLRPFNLGVFQAAARQGVRVVPVALQGVREIMPDRRFLPRPGRVCVTLGEPLRAQDDSWPQILVLAQRARQVIANHCGEPLSERRLRRED